MNPKLKKELYPEVAAEVERLERLYDADIHEFIKQAYSAGYMNGRGYDMFHEWKDSWSRSPIRYALEEKARFVDVACPNCGAEVAVDDQEVRPAIHMKCPQCEEWSRF